MAGTDASEGQALWQPGGAEEDSRLREGNRHLHLAYDDDEEEEEGLTEYKDLYSTKLMPIQQAFAKQRYITTMM